MYPCPRPEEDKITTSGRYRTVQRKLHILFSEKILMLIKKNRILNNRHTFMLWSMDPEYSILHPTARQTTALVWPVSDATSSKGESALELPLQAKMTPS